MKPFMDRDFLLETETARHLFHDWAEGLPLIDYHCHISPREIWEDRRFRDLTEVWLGGRQPDGSYYGDHYKWRILRSDGAGEEYVTGDKPPWERFLRFVQALEKAPGNPMVHWCNLELRQYFGYDKPLTEETAREAWEYCNARLRTDPTLSVRGILKKAKVAFIGTTDDPADSLEWHRLLREDGSLETLVCPSFRPDKAINIRKPGFGEYIARLAASVDRPALDSAEEVCAALTARLEYFCSLGCRASDHGLDTIPFRPGGEGEAEEAFRLAMRGEEVPEEMAEAYMTKLLLHLGREYRRLGVVMQLHYACPLDPGDDALLGSLIGCFQSGEVPGKIQHGSAWWFNDTRSGMESQLRSLAELGLLGNFVGMLTDSRSFLSYARHDYFRRIFCNLLGNWVENGEFPPNERILKTVVEGVCYANARRYFSL